MRIKLLLGGRFINDRLKAGEYQAGDELEARDWYGKSLVESGFAEVIVPVEEKTEEEQPEQPAAQSFMSLPFMTGMVQDELHRAGILTTDQLKAAVANGTIVNIPGVGMRRYARWKRVLGIE